MILVRLLPKRLLTEKQLEALRQVGFVLICRHGKIGIFVEEPVS